MNRSIGARALLPAIVALLLVDTAQAEPLTIDGVWGNTAGCRFDKGIDTNDDSRMMLTADRVETYATYCEWVQVSAATDGTQVATGLCGHEGEDFRSVETYIIERDLADQALVRVRSSSGEVWGEFRKCP